MDYVLWGRKPFLNQAIKLNGGSMRECLKALNMRTDEGWLDLNIRPNTAR